MENLSIELNQHRILTLPSKETMRTTISELEIQLRQDSFNETAISYGIAFTSESDSPNDILTRTNSLMHEFKRVR
jgi:hypothetical protein